MNLSRIGGTVWLEEIALDYRPQENASDLSGGQKQILSVLRAVSQDAPILILDDPFASPDAARRRGLLDFLEDYKRDHIVILTSHMEDEALTDVRVFCIE